ncbi:hypothetical protein MPTK1_8g13920 [Marchantia polymorpha subsp. ruderalis]|nr:hypothetical protein Mp_8g13920 [Marchantia polymorpha subsp. ruderalis]
MLDWPGAESTVGYSTTESQTRSARFRVVASKLGDRHAMKEMSPCDVEVLKRCLEENQGQAEKCREHIAAFQSTCSRSPGTTPTPAPASSPSSLPRDKISPSSPLG